VKIMKNGCVLLNFAREGIVDTQAVIDGLNAGRLQAYLCDFPTHLLRQHPRAAALPHLGASTREAEENCAIMAAEQLIDYLRNGNILNSVNFPAISMPRGSRYRLVIANVNAPDISGQISTALAGANLNISGLINKSRGELAFTLVDVETEVPQAVIGQLASIQGVLRVRYLPD
jgi:D-3-phosphoglycerate dehydrogenase